MKKLFAAYKRVPLLKKMLVALVAGAAIGLVFGEKATVLEGFGTLFLNLLKMIAVPLVLTNLVAGIASMNDPKMVGRVGGKILLYYLATTVFAIVVGVGVASILRPGLGVVLEGTYEGAVGEIPSIGETLLGLIPTNIIKAMADGNMDKVVVFSAIMGLVILTLPEKEREHLATTFSMLSHLFTKMVGLIMLYAPIGVFALIAKTVGKYGPTLFGALAKFIGSIYLSVLVMMMIYTIMVFLFTKIKPTTFLKTASPIILTAFSTCSSMGAIPINMDCAEKLGVPKAIHSFTIPLGAQINKDGSAIMLGVAFLFTAQAIGVPLTAGTLLRLLVIGLILTTGTSGIPGGGLVILAIMINSFNMPLEVVGVISGIYTINEMAQTMTNCLGDLAGTVITAFTGKEKLLRDAE